MYKLTKYYEVEDINETEKLLFSTRTGELLHLSNEVYNQILNCQYEFINEKVLFKLLSSEILVPEDVLPLKRKSENDQ